MPEKLHRCVDKVKGTGVDNPWAVCNASISEVEDITNHNNKAHGRERSLDDIIRG